MGCDSQGQRVPFGISGIYQCTHCLLASQKVFREHSGRGYLTRTVSHLRGNVKTSARLNSMSQLLVSRPTGKVAASTHMDGNRVNQDLTEYLNGLLSRT